MRAIRWSAVRHLWRPILVLVAVSGSPRRLDSLSRPPTWLSEPSRLASSFLACITWLLFVSSGSYAWSLGKLGEEFTAKTVAGSLRRRYGWRLVNGAYFEGPRTPGDHPGTRASNGTICIVYSRSGRHRLRGVSAPDPSANRNGRIRVRRQFAGPGTDFLFLVRLQTDLQSAG
jgi:hypothetical protein